MSEIRETRLRLTSKRIFIRFERNLGIKLKTMRVDKIWIFMRLWDISVEQSAECT